MIESKLTKECNCRLARAGNFSAESTEVTPSADRTELQKKKIKTIFFYKKTRFNQILLLYVNVCKICNKNRLFFTFEMIKRSWKVNLFKCHTCLKYLWSKTSSSGSEGTGPQRAQRVTRGKRLQTINRKGTCLIRNNNN